MSANEEGREDLSLEANASRARLLRAIEELDRRGHDALDLRLQLRRHGRELALIVGAFVVVATGMAVITVQLLFAFSRWRRRWR